MLAERHAHRNRPRHRPPLALAMLALLAPIIAVIATSPAGESAITATVPVIKRSVAEVAVPEAEAEAVAYEGGQEDLDIDF